MSRLKFFCVNLIFGIQVLLTFFLLVSDAITLPAWLQVVGRLHPLLLHLPIGLLILFFILTLLPKQNNFDQTTLHKITYLILFFTSLTASVTALFGFLLSVHSDYGSTTLTQHRFSGIALGWICYFMLLYFDRPKAKKIFLNGFILLAGATLLFAGHTGASLTHGENFVFEPLMSGQKNNLTPENSSIYQLSIQPILEKKCFSCHNESKAKGGLVMTSIEPFKKGGKHGKEWVDGKPAESNIIKLVELPLSDKKHMSPEGKAQLLPKEINLLKVWIRSGANFENKLADLKANDSLRLMTLAALATEATATQKIYAFNPASKEVIAKLNSPFCSLVPLYQDSPALRADFYVQGGFSVKTLENLNEVHDQLVELNLSWMPVTDKELPAIAKFKNLEVLNLNFSKVATDLTPLKALTHLKSLSLSGTAVTTNAVKDLISLPELKELFIWNTTISPQDQLAMSKKNTTLSIVSSVFTDDKKLRLNLPIAENIADINKKELILKHPMPGVTIRYTIDGSTPDSVSGLIYQAPIPIQHTALLKMCAYKDGWLGSKLYEATCFVQGLKPKQVALLTDAEGRFNGNGAQGLIDGVKGDPEGIDPAWVGYKKNLFAVEFEFDQPVANEITISYDVNTQRAFFPPTKFEVWAGNTKQTMKLLKTVHAPQPTKYTSPEAKALIIPIGAKPFSYFKLIGTPVDKIPTWNNAKGQKALLLVDEIFFY